MPRMTKEAKADKILALQRSARAKAVWRKRKKSWKERESMVAARAPMHEVDMYGNPMTSAKLFKPKSGRGISKGADATNEKKRLDGPPSRENYEYALSQLNENTETINKLRQEKQECNNQLFDLGREVAGLRGDNEIYREQIVRYKVLLDKAATALVAIFAPENMN